MIELYGIKCLGLFALISEKLCRNYFEIFESSLSTYWDQQQQLEQGNQPDYVVTVRAIISLRAVVDFILLFNLNKDPEEEEDKRIDLKEVFEKFISLMFRGNIQTRILAIEGLCKMLMQDKIFEPYYIIAALLQLWIDINII